MTERAAAAPTGGATVTAISRARPAPAVEAVTSAPAGVPLEIPLELIDPSPQNPRSKVENLEGMAESMRSAGVVSPIVVRPRGARYDLIHGHRRLAAAKLAGLATIRAVLDLEGVPDERRDLAVRLVENLHREGLSALDEAHGYADWLAGENSGGQRALAKMVGVSQSQISKRLALLALPEKVQADLDSGGITVSDATELARLADDPKRLKKAIKDGTAWGGVSRAVTTQLRESSNEKARKAAADKVRAAGGTVITTAKLDRDDGPFPVSQLAGVKVEDHAKLPCHAMFVPPAGSTLMAVCTDPHSHRATGSKEGARRQREREEAERAAAKAAREAEATARREFSCELVRKGAPDAGASVLVVQLLAEEGYYSTHVDKEAVADLLGVRADTDNAKGWASAIGAYAAKGTRNAKRAVYAAGLALGESTMSAYHRASGCAAYLEHLASLGYQLSAYEREQLDEARATLADRGAEAAVDEEAVDDEDLDGDEAAAEPEAPAVATARQTQEAALAPADEASIAAASDAQPVIVHVEAVGGGEALEAELQPERQDGRPGVRKVIYTASRTAAWVAVKRITDLPGDAAAAPAAPVGRSRGKATRAEEALAAVTAQPGITIPEIAALMGVKQNYLYRVLPELQGAGKVTKRDHGWFAASAALENQGGAA